MEVVVEEGFQILNNWSQSLRYCLWKLEVAAVVWECTPASAEDVMQPPVEEMVLAWRHDLMAEDFVANDLVDYHNSYLENLKINIYK